MKILYVEDNPTDADLARRALAKDAPEMTLEIAPTIAAARERLERDPYDVVLCDLQLPDGGGLELLAWIRDRGLMVAVVVVTGSGDQASAVAALKAGADDYLVKRHDYLKRLAATLHSAIGSFKSDRARKTHMLRVLYAEHNDFDADLTQRYFAQYAPHIRLEVAANAEAVLERLPMDRDQFTPYDVVLLDYRLPGLDALDLTKILRGERKLDLPIVMVTAHGSEEVAAHALRLGVTEYVTKHTDYQHELALVLEKSYHQVAQDRERTALAHTTRQLNHLLESSPTILYALRLDGEYLVPISVSDNIERLLGYTRDEALHPDWWPTSVHPADLEPMKKRLHSLMEWGHAVQVYRLMDKAGAVHWVRDEQRLIYDEAGDPREIVGAMSDITEQRLAEERLRLDDTIFSTTRDGVLITRADGTIEAVNRALTEITGYDTEELIGQNPRMLQSHRHPPEFYAAMWRQIVDTGCWEGEIWNRRKNSELYPHWLTIRAVRNEHNEIRHLVGVSTDLTQIRHSESRLQHLTHYDALTDLPNRLLVHSRLEHALEHARRHNAQIAMLILDLDQFKSVNDSLGHTAGDELLNAVSQRLTQRMRAEDTIGRLSSDEFAMLLDDIEGHHDVAEIAAGLLKLMEPPFSLQGGHEVYMQASIGISMFPQDGDDADDMLRDAYAALHHVKQEGGNACRFYAAEMNADALLTVELESELRHAEERRQLILHYQPKVDLAHGRIVGAEALLRWRRNEGELMAPEHFIPIAERTGLIISIGAWVVDEACRQIRAWRDEGIKVTRVAINVSARQLRTTALEETISCALQRHQVDAKHLELELTESMLMENPEETVERLIALKALGIKLSLDDFGTGYSSLGYLRRFPIDYLKIDRSFVDGVVHDVGSATIAVSIIALAHRMQLGVIAEGVETKAQLSFLRNNHCDLMQGFYFSEPLPAEKFAQLLREGRSLRLTQATQDTRRTLLVVDDEPAVLASVNRLLRGMGYRLLTAGNGEEALKLLAEHPVQVILSDQRMPQMSGAELMGHIRGLYPNTVRILFSGYTDLNSVVEAVNEGALYKFLFKPWDNEQLLGQLRDAFEYYDAVLRPRAERSG